MTIQFSTPRRPWSWFTHVWMIAMLASAIIAHAPQALAHGAVGVPISRQYQCRLEGNYWGNPSQVPSADCRQAYIEGGASSGGAWPFQQWNELSANPEGWGNDPEELEKAVPDGLLCAAGDPRKAGLDRAPANLWRKTRITPKDGKIDVVWENTQAHNPARMRIYISKSSYDASRPLRWSDLQKIYDEPAPAPIPSHGEGHLPGTTTFYALRVPVPAGRTGDAVLYSYWQREDAGNEGFFNCSDITIMPDEVDPGFPWYQERPYLPHGFAPKARDQVRFRVMGGSPTGLEVVDIHHPITPQNVDPVIWTKELADKLNAGHQQYVQVGVRDGSTIRYDASHPQENWVWLKANYSSAMSIVPGTPEPGRPEAHIQGPNSVQEGASATFSGEHSQGDGLAYQWALPFFKPDGGSTPTITAIAQHPPKSNRVTISLTVTDRHHNKAVAHETVSIIPGGSEPVYPPWNRNDVGSYFAGTKVTGLDGRVWECKPFPQEGWCRITPNVPDNQWPYAAGGPATPQAEDQRAWKLAPGK